MEIGPEDKSLLILQDDHRSSYIWQNPHNNTKLELRRACGDLHNTQDGLHFIHQRMMPYLQLAGFYGSAIIGFIKLDASLITALVERWRPETHTFHIPDGECTITLQDIAILFELPIDGTAVSSGHIGENNFDLCERLLGKRPGPDDFTGHNFIKLNWLITEFGILANDATEEQVQFHTRAYIMKLLGGLLIPSKSTDNVHINFLSFLEDFSVCGSYSWGAAVLAHVYRGLCRASMKKTKQISGCMTLVQLWAWERFRACAPTLSGLPTLTRLPVPDFFVYRPRGYRWVAMKTYTGDIGRTPPISVYRSHFDGMQPDDFNWLPYAEMDNQMGWEIWRAVVPLICFEIVEWHHPDRVMRQFGMQQFIPRSPLQGQQLHKIDRRSNPLGDWQEIFQPFIDIWRHRRHYVVSSPLMHNNPSLNLYAPYMRWYRSITIRGLTQHGVGLKETVDQFMRQNNMYSPELVESPQLPAVPQWSLHPPRRQRRNSLSSIPDSSEMAAPTVSPHYGAGPTEFGAGPSYVGAGPSDVGAGPSVGHSISMADIDTVLSYDTNAGDFGAGPSGYRHSSFIGYDNNLSFRDVPFDSRHSNVDTVGSYHDLWDTTEYQNPRAEVTPFTMDLPDLNTPSGPRQTDRQNQTVDISPVPFTLSHVPENVESENDQVTQNRTEETDLDGATRQTRRFNPNYSLRRFVRAVTCLTSRKNKR